jgi:anti-sigma-K factor RskA
MSPDQTPPTSAEHSAAADVAAYALGALEPAEAEAFRRHLDGCAACAEELRGFQQIVGELPMAVPRVDAPQELKRRVMREVEYGPRSAADRPAESARSRRRRHRDAALRSGSWLRGPTLALCAGVGFALAAVVLVILAFPGRQNSRIVQAQTTVGGTATLRISANRTELVVRHVAPPPPGRIYEVWLQYGKHRPRPNALFGVNRAGDATVAVSGSMYGVSHVMVTAEPAPHGTRLPTTTPVITASPS